MQFAIGLPFDAADFGHVGARFDQVGICFINPAGCACIELGGPSQTTRARPAVDDERRIARLLISGRGREAWLSDEWGQWIHYADGGEVLLKRHTAEGRDEQWHLTAEGTIFLEAVPSPDRLAGESQSVLRARFLAGRADFFAHLTRTARAAGMTLEELGIADLATVSETLEDR